MTIKICEWCVRTVCGGCGWKGYRSRATLSDPRWCPRCLNMTMRGPSLWNRDVIHHPGTLCHFAPAGAAL